MQANRRLRRRESSKPALMGRATARANRPVSRVVLRARDERQPTDSDAIVFDNQDGTCGEGLGEVVKIAKQDIGLRLGASSSVLAEQAHRR